MSSNLPRDIRDEVNRAGPGADRDANALGRRIGQRVDEGFTDRIRGATERAIRNDHNRSLANLRRLFGGSGRSLGKTLSDEFRLGIGAGRPGPAIVSLLNLAGPSLIAAATNLFAAVGVAAAGALTAALTSTLLTGGLLFAAFASGAESLTAGIDIYKEVGTKAGTAIADGMAAGFTNSANVVRDRILPALEGPLQTTGEHLGGLFESLANTLGTDENLSRLATILEINNGFIDNFSTGLNGLATAFLQLWVASKPMIDLVGSRFAEFGTWATNALAAADANGQLATVMDKLVQIANWLFDGLARLGPAIGDWLTNLNVDKMIAGWESFWGLLTNIFSIFGAIADGAGPHFVAIMDNLSAIITNLVNSGVLQTAADRIATLLERFTAFIAEVTATDMGAEIGAFALALLLFGPLLSPVVTILSALATALSAVAGALGAAIAPILLIAAAFALVWTQSENFRNSIMEVVTTLSGQFSSIWDEIQPKIQPLVDAVLRFGAALGDFLAPIIERFSPILFAFMDAVGTVVSFFISALTDIFNLIASLLSGDFEGAWEALKSLITNIAQFIWNILQNLFTFIASIIGAIISQIVAFFQGLWDQLWEIGEAGVAWLTSILQAGWENLVALVHFLFDPWIAFFSQLWTEIANIATNVWNAIWAFFETILTAITDGVRNAGNWIQNAWNTALTWVRDTTVNIWNSIWAFFENILTSIADGVRAAGTWIQNAWNTALSWVRDTTVNIWNSIWAFFENILTSIADGVRSAGQWIQDAWNNALNWVYNTAVNIWNSILSFIQNILDGIGNAVSGVVDTIAGAWDGVYDAIVQPIVDAYNAVVGWIGDIKAAVTGALDWLGGKVGEANDKLNGIIAAQAEAGTVTANMFNPDAIGPPAQLARGGIISATPGGINAVVGEGRNDERIEPLDSQGLSTRDRALITQIVNSMVGGISTVGGGTVVQVRIGERELSDFTAEVIANHEAELARRLHQRRRR